jgi:hypothetical protein
MAVDCAIDILDKVSTDTTISFRLTLACSSGTPVTPRYEVFINSVIKFNGPESDILVSNLDPGTTYLIKVLAYDNDDATNTQLAREETSMTTTGEAPCAVEEPFEDPIIPANSDMLTYRIQWLTIHYSTITDTYKFTGTSGYADGGWTTISYNVPIIPHPKEHIHSAFVQFFTSGELQVYLGGEPYTLIDKPYTGYSYGEGNFLRTYGLVLKNDIQRGVVWLEGTLNTTIPEEFGVGYPLDNGYLPAFPGIPVTSDDGTATYTRRHGIAVDALLKGKVGAVFSIAGAIDKITGEPVDYTPGTPTIPPLTETGTLTELRDKMIQVGDYANLTRLSDINIVENNTYALTRSLVPGNVSGIINMFSVLVGYPVQDPVPPGPYFIFQGRHTIVPSTGQSVHICYESTKDVTLRVMHHGVLIDSVPAPANLNGSAEIIINYNQVGSMQHYYVYAADGEELYHGGLFQDLSTGFYEITQEPQGTGGVTTIKCDYVFIKHDNASVVKELTATGITYKFDQSHSTRITRHDKVRKFFNHIPSTFLSDYRLVRFNGGPDNIIDTRFVNGNDSITVYTEGDGKPHIGNRPIYIFSKLFLTHYKFEFYLEGSDDIESEGSVYLAMKDSPYMTVHRIYLESYNWIGNEQSSLNMSVDEGNVSLVLFNLDIANKEDIGNGEFRYKLIDAEVDWLDVAFRWVQDGYNEGDDAWIKETFTDGTEIKWES